MHLSGSLRLLVVVVVAAGAGVASASRHVFSVDDDLFAYPQSEIKFVKPIGQATARTFLKELTEQGTGSVNGHGDVVIPASFSQDRDSKREYELMLLDKQPFLCSLPVQNITEPVQDQQKTGEENALSLAIAKKRGWELLRPMRDTCLYKHDGWWTYKLCHDREMVQFHALPPERGVQRWPPREDPKSTYVMGRVPEISGGKETQKQKEAKKEGDVPSTEVSILGTTRYLVHYLSHGTVCDLTLRERKSEIQYHCDPRTGKDYIERVSEIATCSYVVVVKTPRLCGDEEFLPASSGGPEEVGKIECAPIGEEAKTLPISASLRHNAETTKAREISDGNKLGNIVPGAASLLRNPLTDEKIDISHILDSQKVTILASHPGGSAILNGEKVFTLSQEELRKIGIDPNFVASLRREVEHVAGGRKWRMEMIEFGSVNEDGDFVVDSAPSSGSGKGKKKPKRKFQGIVEKFDPSQGGAEGGGIGGGAGGAVPADGEKVGGLRSEEEWDELVNNVVNALKAQGDEEGDGEGDGEGEGKKGDRNGIPVVNVDGEGALHEDL